MAKNLDYYIAILEIRGWYRLAQVLDRLFPTCPPFDFYASENALLEIAAYQYPRRPFFVLWLFEAYWEILEYELGKIKTKHG